MKYLIQLIILLFISIVLSSCVSKKKYLEAQTNLDRVTADLHAANEKNSLCQNDLNVCRASLALLTDQLTDCKSQRDKQLTQVGDLTVLSKDANENINRTLAQLKDKDEYIRMLLAAKSKADSINLALAVNLKGVLKEGLADNDVEIKVDKTVVFVNISDKMLFDLGKYSIKPRAKEVLGKIAAIVQSRPELDVMVEGYTDNKPIKTECIDDNWDLSVKRATSVVRVLQKEYNVDPNKLIAAGRGEYNILASNETDEGRAINRRTRIIIMPRLNQFYDLLDPSKAASSSTNK
jgi:chemotaxis protein MotB